jgi:hypothetical protein
MTNKRLPRLELRENPNNQNDFIIFRHQIRSKKMPTFSKKGKVISKKNKTRKHKKRKTIFNIF